MKTILMNIIHPRSLLLGAVLTSGIFFNLNVYADGGESHEAKQKIPATVDAIWESIDEESQELGEVIEAGKLGEAHHHAFAIRDLVAALPSRSKSLPTKKLAKVKFNSAFVATLAERLDASGDANDKAGTESNFKKLQKILKSIRKNYSSSVLP